MLRFLSLTLIVVSGLLLNACLTIEEKLSLQKDGSGTLLTTIDLGGMLSNPLVRMGLEEEMKKEGGEVPMKVDSVIDIYGDMLKSNPQWTVEERGLLQKLDSRMMMDMEAGEGNVTVRIPFSSLAELTRIQSLMADANKGEDDEESGSPFDGMGGMGAGNVVNNFIWKQGKLERNTSMVTDLLETMGMEDEETMGMMKMMLGDAKIIYLMEFPGQVKKVSGFPGHTVENGNTIRQEFGMLELFDSPETIDEGLDGSVKYKK